MKRKGIFDCLADISYKKTDINTYTENDWKVYNPYMIHRFLSMKEELIGIMNLVQKYYTLDKKTHYVLMSDILPKQKLFAKYIKGKNYEIIHYESPDKRGIDVALLYQKKYFTPIFHQSFNPNIYRNNRKVYTRDQLLVTGYLDDELIHIIVNHWPSRSGGEIKSRPLREKAAYQNTKIIEQVRAMDLNAKIIIMGDFNDDPINTSFKNVLKTKSDKKKVTENDIYNPYEDMFQKGSNTLVFRDNINLFDQLLITSPLLDKGEKDFSSYKMYKAMIFNKRFLTTKRGRYKGYPLRSFSFGKYTGGYSDHYPVYMYLIKEL